MAKGSVDNIEYAIKLYVSRSAFEAESGLYRQRHDPKAKGLSQFLPWVRTCSVARRLTALDC